MTQPVALAPWLPAAGDPLAAPAGLTLLGDVLDELAADSLSPLPDRVGLVPGGSGVAWDECAGGQLWVRVARVFPTVELPDAGPVVQRPGTTVVWAADLEVGLLRCAATTDDAGNPPTADALAADALVGLDDARAVRTAIVCRFVDPMVAYVLSPWLPVTPLGGCVGGLTTVTVTLPVVRRP